MAAAQGLGFAPAQGLGFAAAQGLIFFFGAHCARAGLALGPATRIAPPARTPAKTTSGTIVVDSNILFLDCMFSFPPERRPASPMNPGTGAAPCKTQLRKWNPNLAVRPPVCGIKATHFIVIYQGGWSRIG
ncbi:MAG: hypothetical protein ACTSQ7_15765 [Alphaproteobacteria bacterium]